MNFDRLQDLTPFRFAWAVLDQPSYNDYSHQAHSDGKAVTGSYHVALPDGRIQVVTYKADEYGYVADVTYQGDVKYPSLVLYTKPVDQKDSKGKNTYTEPVYQTGRELASKKLKPFYPEDEPVHSRPYSEPKQVNPIHPKATYDKPLPLTYDESVYLTPAYAEPIYPKPVYAKGEQTTKPKYEYPVPAYPVDPIDKTEPVQVSSEKTQPSNTEAFPVKAKSSDLKAANVKPAKPKAAKSEPVHPTFPDVDENKLKKVVATKLRINIESADFMGPIFRQVIAQPAKPPHFHAGIDGTHLDDFSDRILLSDSVF